MSGCNNHTQIGGGVPMDEKLKAALGAAKGAVHNFALVAKGPMVVYILVSKTPIKDDVVQAAKKEHGGNAVVRGKCQGQNGELVFRVAKDPPVDGTKLKEFIVKATSLPIKPRFEVIADGSAKGVEGSETETEQAGSATKNPAGKSATGAPQSAPAPKPAADDPAALLKKRLEALLPKLKAAIAAGGAAADEIKRKASEAGAFGRKNEHAQANRLLDEAEALLKKGTSTPPPAAKPANTLGIWQEAKDLAGEQISKLQAALRETGDELLMRIADQGLNGITKRLQVGLQTALMEFDGAPPGMRAARSEAARKAVADFRTFLKTDPGLPLLADNPFGVRVSLLEDLTKTMSALDAALVD
jgi:hypothetical protein